MGADGRISANGLIEDVLPARSQPLPDELLSSWIVRLAMAHGLKLHTFCVYLFGKRAIWNRDIDKSADDKTIEIIARATRTPLCTAYATRLASYEGTLYERHNSNGNKQFLMPLGIYHRVHRHHGLQFCPLCLRQDSEPYFRKMWRLSFITVCTKHRVRLLDACPRCDAPVNFHRDELGERDKVVTTEMTACFACHYDLREANEATVMATNESIAFQSRFTDGIEAGAIRINEYEATYPILYFPVLHQLMKVLAGKRGAKLFFTICREAEIKMLVTEQVNRKTDIARLRVGVRYALVQAAAYLLGEWSKRFVNLCEQNRTWSSTLLRDFEGAPFWYWQVVHEHLYRVSYNASEAEIEAAVAYLTKSGGTAYKKAISRLFGTQAIFRKHNWANGFYRLTINRTTLKVAKHN